MDSSLAEQPIEPEVRKGGGNKGLEQAYVIRDIAANHAIELRDCNAETLQEKSLRARALRDCTSVWEGADDRIRIKRGQPLPGSLRPEKPKAKSSKSSASPLESLPESKPE